jgi:hypothetical protein
MAGMERLTYRYADGEAWASIYKVSACGEHECKGPIIERLAAYEDTGMTPEEIDALQKREQGLAEMLVNVSCGCAVSYSRLAELAQAEKDGRLVVLPCKPDEIFYQWKRGDDCPSVSRFEGVEISEDGEITYPMKRWGEAFTLDDFGKTIFLSRADAKAALAAQKE